MSQNKRPTHETLPTQTQQHFESECNINTIVKKYRATGILGDPTKRANAQALFADLTAYPSYVEAFDYVETAASAFLHLPADIRARFGGDPRQLLAFMENPANRLEAIKLGLIAQPPDPEPQKVGEKPKKCSVQTRPLLDVTGLTDTNFKKLESQLKKMREEMEANEL